MHLERTAQAMSDTGDLDRLDVLVVDDDAAAGDSTADILRSAGLGALRVPTVDEGVAACRARSFDAVVLDHRVAGTDGERFFEHAVDPGRVVIVSASAPERLLAIQGRHRAEVQAVLSKPVPPSELIAAVSAAITATRRGRQRQGDRTGERAGSG